MLVYSRIDILKSFNYSEPSHRHDNKVFVHSVFAALAERFFERVNIIMRQSLLSMVLGELSPLWK